MDVVEIKDQDLSLVLAAGFLICDYCKIVDKDLNRSEVGYPCPMCKQPSKRGHMYFNVQALILIDLMQESFHSKPWKAMRDKEIEPHYVSVVTFFCTLKEILLYRFINRLLSAQKLPERVCERLLEDNNSHLHRMNKLFPSLTGKGWRTAIKELDKKSKIRYGDLSDFLKEVTDARNQFLHEGDIFGIDKAMVENCIRNIEPLLNLFVELHNQYIYPLSRMN